MLVSEICLSLFDWINFFLVSICGNWSRSNSGLNSEKCLHTPQCHSRLLPHLPTPEYGLNPHHCLQCPQSPSCLQNTNQRMLSKHFEKNAHLGSGETVVYYQYVSYTYTNEGRTVLLQKKKNPTISLQTYWNQGISNSYRQTRSHGNQLHLIATKSKNLSHGVRVVNYEITSGSKNGDS